MHWYKKSISCTYSTGVVCAVWKALVVGYQGNRSLSNGCHPSQWQAHHIGGAVELCSTLEGHHWSFDQWHLG